MAPPSGCARSRPMLEVRDLRAGYGGTEVLRGVSLDVNAGEVVAVLGSNGVGKTTLNKVLSGVVPATSGTIRFNGAALEHAAAPEIVTAGLIHVRSEEHTSELQSPDHLV